MKKRPIVLLLCAVNGCAYYSHTNKPLTPKSERARTPVRATFNIQDPRGNEKVLVLLSISGGGSRAAYLGASAMLAMEKVFGDLDLLKQVDVISAVSGGCLPAAYYCVSEDPVRNVCVPFSGGFRLAASAGEETVPEAIRKKLEISESKKLLFWSGKMRAKERKVLLRITPEEHHPAIKALYEASRTSRRLWDADTVKKLMTRNYIGRWAWKLLAPRPVTLTAFTAFDRSDAMAEIFSDRLFDFGLRRLGRDMGMRHLNLERPYLIINATNATADTSDEYTFSKIFTFTDEDFREKLASDIQTYDIGRAVMASSAYPGAFNYMTLRDYRDPSGRGVMADLQGRGSYTHVFDGGNADNLGLESLKRLIIENHHRYRNIVVIAIDAHRQPGGVPRDEYDSRKFLDYGLDRNFLDTFDVALENHRRRLIHEFRKRIIHHESLETPLDLRDKMFFHHLCFDSVKDEALRTEALQIPTNFKIDDEHVETIDSALPDLVCEEDSCWRVIKRILLDEGDTHPSLRPGMFECSHGVPRRKEPGEPAEVEGG